LVDDLPSLVADTLLHGRTILGEDVVYDDELFDSLGLPDFGLADYAANDAALESSPLDDIIEAALQRHRLKGLSGHSLESFLAGYPEATAASDLLHNGARSFMTPQFHPNGGKECSLGGSYLKYRPICNDALLQLVREGKALVFSKDALQRSGAIQELHLNPLVWAPKTGKVKGRTCLNLSKSTKNFRAVNECVDTEASHLWYKPPDLPLLPDVAEMACERRKALGHSRLAGATVDVASAYHQFAQSVASAKYHATLLRIPSPDPSHREKWLQVVVIYLVGAFGFKIAGDIYCTLGGAITRKHNEGLSVPRSLTYIDDGILIDDQKEIQASLHEYMSAVMKVFGPDGVNMEKVKTWAKGLEAIGWEFDFEAWRVRPRARGMAKLAHYLFVVIPVGAVTVHEKDLERLCGLLTWYAPGIPAGTSFTASLFRCKARVGQSTRRVRLSDIALRDINWWRALVLVVSREPNVLAADIDSVRRTLTPTIFLRCDASSLFGGGGYLADTHGGPARAMESEGIRWTRMELLAFERMAVSINVLEFFVAVFYILLWADELRGRCVLLECDNTAAVSWLMKKRAVRGSAPTDCLVRLLSLFCLRESIVVTSLHIKGIDNVTADFRSRDLDYLSQDADEGLVNRALLGGSAFDGWSRRELCRSVLLLCVTKPDEMLGPRGLELLTRLVGTSGPSIAASSTQTQIA
jgi:hypothetical protein